MTVAEKIGQLWQTNGIGSEPTGNADSLVESSSVYELIRQGELGSILNEVNPTTINAMQRVAVEKSRLGIPLIIGRDVIHGYRTVFPIPLGQAASWNPDMVESADAVAAREARSVRHPLDVCADGRHRPRSALGSNCRRLRRRPLSGERMFCRGSARFSRRRSCVARPHRRLRQALLRLRSCGRRPGLQHYGHLAVVDAQRLPAVVSRRGRRRRGDADDLFQRRERRAQLSQCARASATCCANNGDFAVL